MIFVKILSILLGIIAISKAYLDWKSKNDSFIVFLFWIFSWVIVIIFSLYPILISKINFLAGQQGTGVNTFIGASFVFILFVIYRIYRKANRLEKQIQKIVTEIGLKDFNNTKKKSINF